MLICPRCNAENREAAVGCESCGAPRSVGRFGSAQPRRPVAAPSPRVSAAPARDTREPRESLESRDPDFPAVADTPRGSSIRPQFWRDWRSRRSTARATGCVAVMRRRAPPS